MLETHLSRRGLLAGAASFVLAPRLFAAGPKKWDGKMELAVSVKLATIEGTRVHRPYVAVWIEDEKGAPVRTLSLWVQTERRGPRWIPDLRRWWRDVPNHDELIPTVSSATRNAGEYTLVWDGKDDKGKLVPQGKYTVFVEAVREHGTYGLSSKTVDLGGKPLKEKMDANAEVEAATVEYRKRK